MAMATPLSSAAWMAHNLGIATALGGTLFGRRALEPAVREIGERQGDQISEAAWRRFSWINLAAHGAIAATWFVGRGMLTGRGVSETARKLVVVKDALVVASLATGIASVILGRVLGKRIRDGQDREELQSIERAVAVVGATNLLANAGVGVVTTALAMEGNKSLPFSAIARRLP